MHIEDFFPYQKTVKEDQAKQKTRRLARALMQVLKLKDDLELGLLLGMDADLSNQQVLEVWVRHQLSQDEEEGSGHLQILAGRLQQELLGRWE